MDGGAGQRRFVIQASSDPGIDPPRIVLKPKLRAPAPRPEQLVRRGLLKLLHNALDCEVSVISAPTGYGKTTLLAHWRQVEEAEVPFAWVSLDEQDNDPIRLWRHIVEALRRAVPEEEDFGSDVLVGMNAAGQRFIETTLPTLINEISELPQRIVLVLDDYQFVTEVYAHESVAFFVDHLPENVHLVILSRSDPHLPLGRLRAMGEMNEIRTEQLAFTEEEAECLLNEKMGLGIGPDDLSMLLEHTEGWPAGIYLASLSLQNKEDKHAFIESFSGSDRYIVGLLGEEVLAHLPGDVREFLLETSVLRTMAGPLCDAVTGREDSAKLLRELARSNLFVVSLDHQGEWYRYHHLFAELLLYELRGSRPDVVPTLRKRASAWLEGAGYFEGAIGQAIVATDYERAGLLAARHWYGYVLAGQSTTVQWWLESLREEVAHDAALTLVKAWICALGGRREESERFLTLAEGIPHEGPLPDGTASVESGAAILRASFGYGGVQSGVEDARRALELEPEQSSPWAAMVRFGLGAELYLSGETSRARTPLEEALLLTEDGQPLVRVAALSFLSLVAADEGHLEEAEFRAREAHAMVDRFRLQGIPQATLAPIALGRALAGRGKLEEAQEELEKGISARQKLPGLSPWPTLVGLLALAPVLSARGDRAGGRAALAEARVILEPFADDAGMFPGLLERQKRRLRPRRPREGQLDGELTGRELDVLLLLGGELSVQQMAHSLYVAPSTVRTQVKSIYRKLGVSSRDKAVEEAQARGLI